MDTSAIYKATLSTDFVLVHGFPNLTSLSIQVFRKMTNENQFRAAMACVSNTLTALDIYILNDAQPVAEMLTNFPHLPVITSLKFDYDFSIPERTMRTAILNVLQSCGPNLTRADLQIADIRQKVINILASFPLDHLRLSISAVDYKQLLERVENGSLRELCLNNNAASFLKEQDPILALLPKSYPLATLWHLVERRMFYEVRVGQHNVFHLLAFNVWLRPPEVSDLLQVMCNELYLSKVVLTMDSWTDAMLAEVLMLPTTFLKVEQWCALKFTDPIAKVRKSHPKMKKLILDNFKLLIGDCDVPSLLLEDSRIEEIELWACRLSPFPKRVVTYDCQARRYEFRSCETF
jgi:hypothetical protein